MKTKRFLNVDFFPKCFILIVVYSCFPFLSPDYAVPFPVTGEVTFAIALLLIDIIEDRNLHVKHHCQLLFCELTRICLKLLLLEASRELHEKMDMLYTSSEDEIGPFCTKVGINKKWLCDHHQYDLEPGMIVTNGAILELYQYIHVKNTADLNWADGVRCLACFYPDKEHELSVPKVWQSEWKRLQAKRNSKKYAAKKTLRDEWLTEEYQLSNRATPAASVDNIVTEDDPGLKDDGVDETTSVDSDFFHRQYDSSI